ncbi:MAG: M23 family metallopeptidase [Bdellovibrionota bacterium]
MKLMIRLSLIFLASCAHQNRSISTLSCKVGAQEGCQRNEVCMNNVTGPACIAIPQIAPLQNLVLPFDSRTEVVCTHSSGEGSHSWPNAFYALDLANHYNKPAATVRASGDGKAFVFLGVDGKLCPKPAGSPAHAESSTCGNSWGNNIKILHEGGYATFYVHLEKVLVKTGDFVKQGQPIGIEGWTGAAGHRHLHWSVQRIGGMTSSEWEQHISWDGQSVPFTFQAIVKGQKQIINSADLICPHFDIGNGISESQQPHLTGVLSR